MAEGAENATDHPRISRVGLSLFITIINNNHFRALMHADAENATPENELNQDAEDATNHPHDIQLADSDSIMRAAMMITVHMNLASANIGVFGSFFTRGTLSNAHVVRRNAIPRRNTTESLQSRGGLSVTRTFITNGWPDYDFNFRFKWFNRYHRIVNPQQQIMLNHDFRFIQEAGADQEAADAFKCPITRELFIDPVTPEYKGAVATDNKMKHVFERSALLSWFQVSRTCPLTRVKCTGNVQNRPDITDAQVKFIQEEKERLLQDIPKRQEVVDRYYGLVPYQDSQALSSTPFLLESHRRSYASGLCQQVELGMG